MFRPARQQNRPLPSATPRLAPPVHCPAEAASRPPRPETKCKWSILTCAKGQTQNPHGRLHALKAQRHESPGQRPGNNAPKTVQALKGRHKINPTHNVHQSPHCIVYGDSMFFKMPAKYPCKPARTPSEISGRRSFVLQMAWTRMLAKGLRHCCFALSGLVRFVDSQPRALPWAALFCAFGAAIGCVCRVMFFYSCPFLVKTSVAPAARWSSRAESAETCQPRATPWEQCPETVQALKGRYKIS